jgi:hypothetical protein
VFVLGWPFDTHILLLLLLDEGHELDYGTMPSLLMVIADCLPILGSGFSLSWYVYACSFLHV